MSGRGERSDSDSHEAARLDERQRRTAMQRRAIILAFGEFERTVSKTSSRAAQFEEFVQLHREDHPGMPSRFVTLRSWKRRYEKHGLVGLVGRRGRAPAEPHPRLEDFFKSLYLLASRPPVGSVYRHVRALAHREHLACPSLRWWQMRVNDPAFLPESVRVLHREGRRAYEAKCLPPLEQDNQRVPAGDMWVADHSLMDVFVLDPRTSKAARPWLTEFLDVGSRMVVGAEVTLGPNADVLASTFAEAVSRFGAPRVCKWDNGLDMTGRKLHGLSKAERRARERFLRAHPDQHKVALRADHYALVQTLVPRNIFALPYNAKAKIIERHFRTVQTQFNKFVPSYCGSSPSERPERLGELMDAGKYPTMEAYRRELMGWLFHVYNTNPHSGLGGLSPVRALKERRSGPVRRVAPEALSLLLHLEPTPRKVSKRGVRVQGIWYGGFSGTLRALLGQKVLVAVPRHSAERAHILTLDRKFLCVVQANARFDPALYTEDTRRAQREQRRIARLDRDWRDASWKRGLQVAELARIEQIERARAEAEKDGDGVADESLSNTVLTGFERAAEDRTAAEQHRALREIAEGEPPSEGPRYEDSDFIDPADFGSESELLRGPEIEIQETDESDETYRRLVSDD